LSKNITIAICSHNSAHALPGLVEAIRRQDCPFDAEILVVDNNSGDNTETVVAQLAGESGIPIRYVIESTQGIPYARNRAVEESICSSYLAFIDTDELPYTGWLEAAVDALHRESAECVGGAIRVRLVSKGRPKWLTDELLGFLGEVNHGPEPFWIRDRSTPVWSGNIAYDMNVFANGLRFDVRYNRRGKGVGGGSDGLMFRELLETSARIRYRPDMSIDHFIDSQKLNRGYFLKLHFIAGRRFGEFETEDYEKTIYGVPPFMLRQMLGHMLSTSKLILSRDSTSMRQAMNLTYALGTIVGRIRRERTGTTRIGSAKSAPTEKS
jgi:glycosyltransferase involved in cell wall biosynthesis